ncbi:MAG: hypothetical protein LBR47_02430 [Spirochaetaceae bacterium]|jgi:hypothetical protein|nr:hypothetical protein [Spirochaetaceae bacterium]
MNCYYIKSCNQTADFLTVTGRNEEGFFVRIIRDLDGYEEIIDEFMTTELFESCIRTGYLIKAEGDTAAIA